MSLEAAKLPGHWMSRRVKRVAKYVTTRATETTNPVALEHVESWTGRLLPNDATYDAEGIAFLPGDLLFGKLRPYLAKVLVASEPGQAVGDFIVMRPDAEAVEPCFLGHCLRTPAIIEELTAGSYGSKMPRTSWEELSQRLIAAPPLDEQRRIAAFLDHETARIDELVQEQERLKELLQSKLDAALERLVRLGVRGGAVVRVGHAVWPDEVPEHWSIGRAKLAVRLLKGGVWGADAAGDDFDIPCVRVADFDRRRAEVVLDAPTIRNVKPSERVDRVLSRGDLVLERSGGGDQQPVGFMVLYAADEDAVCSNFTSRVQLTEGMHPSYWRFVHWVLYRLRLNLRSIKQTSGIQNLDAESYLNEVVPFPPLDEQVEIAEAAERLLEATQQLSHDVETGTALLRERRSALITAAVTGQIDVSTWTPPDDWLSPEAT